jgi:hypothetical protein
MIKSQEEIERMREDILNKQNQAITDKNDYVYQIYKGWHEALNWVLDIEWYRQK